MQVGQALRLPGTTESQTEKALVPATEHAACALWAREAPGPREPPASPLHHCPPQDAAPGLGWGCVGGWRLVTPGLGGQGAQLGGRAGEAWGGDCTPPPRGVP